MRRAWGLLGLTLTTAIVACARPAVEPETPGGAPQIAFPGQFAIEAADRRFPAWTKACASFAGDDRIACLEAVGFDFGGHFRYAAANAALAPSRNDETRVVFFGDSITDNWSRAGFGGFFPGRPYVNRGIAGQTTAQMLVRFRADVIDLRPKVVVILAGTNDIAGNTGRMTAEAIGSNLASMAELARGSGIGVVLASLLPVADDKRGEKGAVLKRTRLRPNDKILEVNRWLARYARERRFVYLDYFEAMVDERGALRADLNDDGLHPNAQGYAVMAPRAERAIALALRGE